MPVPHQTLLFSATMPKEIEQLAAQYLNKPVKVKIGRVSVPTANVAQTLQRCSEQDEKMELLVAMLQVRDTGAAGALGRVGCFGLLWQWLLIRREVLAREWAVVAMTCRRCDLPTHGMHQTQQWDSYSCPI